MSINSSLIKLANKIDTDGTSDITPDYKNPNNSIEKSIERIADNYVSGGGGSGGGGEGKLIVLADEPMETVPSWITDISPMVVVFETNAICSDYPTAIGISVPGIYEYFQSEDRWRPVVSFMGIDEYEGIYYCPLAFYVFSSGRFTMYSGFFVANAEDGPLYYVIEQSM